MSFLTSLVVNAALAKAEERKQLVQKRDAAHMAFIEAVRAKHDTMQAYTEVNRAMQELLAFDARNN